MNKIKILALLMSMVLLVSSTITVNAEADHPYVDIKEDHWANDIAVKSYELGIDSGFEGGYFYSSHYTLVGEACNMLYRFARIIGKAEKGYLPKDENDPYLKAVKDEWCYEGISWCFDNGILHLPDGSIFSEPMNMVKKAELAYMMCRYLKVTGIQMEVQPAEDGFNDIADLPEWAKEAIEEMRQYELMRGIGGGKFAPDSNVIRAGTLVTISRLFPYVEKMTAIESAPRLSSAVHNEAELERIEPTCTEEGRAAGIMCEICGYEPEPIRTIPAAGHESDGFYYVDDFDPYSEFVERYKLCIVCGETFEHGNYCHNIPYSDVNPDHWYYYSVRYVDFFGFMNGTSKYSFSPDTAMSRAMLITVLYRICGAPEVEGTVPFDDLQADQTWYHDAVTWAYNNDIVTGTSNTKFSPEMSLSREQLATILYRFAEKLGIDVSSEADLSDFHDSDRVSDWSRDALSWVCGVGLVKGADKGDGVYLDPVGTASRAQVATVLMRFMMMEIETEY